MNDTMTKSFEVSSVCREDLTRFISKKKAEKITDEQMQYLARKMGDLFCDAGYWEAIETFLEQL